MSPFTATYPLSPDGPHRLRVTWEWGFRNVMLTLDGRLLGGAPDVNALKKGVRIHDEESGQDFVLEHYASLLGRGILVRRGERPIPGCPGSPEYEIRRCGNVLFIDAGLTLMGLLRIGLMDMRGTDPGWGFAAIAVILFLIFLGSTLVPAFVIAGFLIRARKRWALVVGVVLHCLVFVGSAVGAAFDRGPAAAVTSLLIPALLFAALCRGFPAFRALAACRAIRSGPGTGVANHG